MKLLVFLLSVEIIELSLAAGNSFCKTNSRVSVDDVGFGDKQLLRSYIQCGDLCNDCNTSLTEQQCGKTIRKIAKSRGPCVQYGRQVRRFKDLMITRSHRKEAKERSVVKCEQLCLDLKEFQCLAYSFYHCSLRPRCLLYSQANIRASRKRSRNWTSAVRRCVKHGPPL